MKTVIAALTLITSSLLAKAQVSLLTGPIVNPANGHSYYLTTPTTWTNAEAFARAMGGHLATIRNSQEDSWIYSTFIHNPGVTDTLWVGISDAAQEGNFVWASGETSAYRNWAPGEPNNLSNIEDYGRYFQSYHAYAGKWNDAPNGAPSNGVIEKLCTPHRATATAQIAAGAVVGATLTDVGCGYTTAPLVLIVGGGGSGASAVAQVSNGVVTSISISAPGTGYTNTPTVYIYSPQGAQAGLLKAVKPSLSDLLIGINYQLQVSSDLTNWTNEGAPFTATAPTMIYPQYWDVDNWRQLFFRVQVAP